LQLLYDVTDTQTLIKRKKYCACLIDEKRAYFPVIYGQTETSVLDNIHSFCLA